MFRDLQKTQTVFTDIAAQSASAPTSLTRRRRRAARACSCPAAIFRCWSCSPRLDDCSIRMTTHSSASRALWCSATTIGRRIWARSNHPQQTGHRQRPEPHHRRRRAEGLRRHDNRDAACRVRPDHAALGAGRRHRLVASDGLLGLPVRAPEAGGHNRRRARALGTQYHAIINDVEAPLQKDMSPQTMARFRAKPILLAPGGRGQSSVPDEAKTPLRLLLASRRSCCSSPAPTSRTCCSRDRRRAPERWPSGSRSARAGRA